MRRTRRRHGGPWPRAGPGTALRNRRQGCGRLPPVRTVYCATDLGVGTMRVTLIAERSISSVTRGATSFFQ